MTNVELMLECITAALHDFDAKDQLPVKSGDLKDWVKEHRPEDFARLEPSWANNLLTAQGLDHARIVREPGTYKYGLRKDDDGGGNVIAEDEADADDENITGTDITEGEARKKQREKCLYPVLAAWVRAQGFGADDTSDSKSGGAWGNPDVTGIRVVEGALNQNFLEILTVEAKTSRRNWKREFFEAVSHKRFANRVYFAFAYGSGKPSLEALDIAERNEMRFYGEKFRVGILVIFLPDAIYTQLHSTSETLPTIKADEIRIEELWPAVHEQPHPDAANRHLCEVLKLTSSSAIYSFAAKLE